MKFHHIMLICGMTLALVSCDKIGNKNSRSQGAADAVVTNAPVQEGDATAADDNSKNPDNPKIDPAMALTGKELYAKLCASCHQPLATSDVGKTNINKLKAAIANQPTMAGLKETKIEDLEAIVAALSDISPGKGKNKDGEEAVDDGMEN